jgi:hypothetical protein
MGQTLSFLRPDLPGLAARQPQTLNDQPAKKKKTAGRQPLRCSWFLSEWVSKKLSLLGQHIGTMFGL